VADSGFCPVISLPLPLTIRTIEYIKKNSSSSSNS
jgi:hypothetical protein